MFKPLLQRITLAFFAAGCLSFAHAVDLKPGHPVEYVVKEGDTLWDLSQKFLDDAWLWPEIWQVNEQINNPHLIYPGDTIGLVYKGKKVKVTVKERSAASNGVIKLTPSARVSALASAIPPIPMTAISSFMSNSRIVKSKQLQKAPYVVAGDDNRILAGGGGKVYARGFDKNEKPENAYGIYRKGQFFVDPDTSEVLGLEAREVGVGRVQAWDGDVATLSLGSTREEVLSGDRLLATDDRQVIANFVPSSPPDNIYGRMIAVMNGVSQIGQYQVVVVNQGKRDGVTEGNVLAIYKEGDTIIDRVTRQKVKLPSERAGLMMLFRVFDKVSYGLILRAKVALSVGDEVRSPQ
ncbi:LysM peptidoglycan-binding domain-containing protein [Oceaniserpentilla sp. 4NH20-0058]|uniref:LysM peptidoglycan-binding domain-containing protein n=1 Tax=Oceaniserpentilla sp. 4NH20-0058 TaxID=3127660 RepID=UPI00310392ED